VVFLAFATSKITFIKLFGVGLAMAVLMDATIIRATLVPAFMRLAGDANWWAPPFMRRIYERWGVHDLEGYEPEAVSPVAPDEIIDVRDEPEPTQPRRRERPLRAPSRTPAKQTAARSTSTKKTTTKKKAASTRKTAAASSAAMTQKTTQR
jgi:RND superfamily putative drug exporter